MSLEGDRLCTYRFPATNKLCGRTIAATSTDGRCPKHKTRYDARYPRSTRAPESADVRSTPRHEGP